MTTPAETAYEQAQEPDGSIKQLVLEHLELVRSIADHIHVGLHPAVSEEDLISAGTLGLVEAAHRFDPSHGVKFSTFAYHRVKGAMMDCLRQNDALGKSARKRLSRVRRAARGFRSEHGRPPRLAELAEAVELTEEAVLRCLSYEKWDSVGSLESTASGGQEEGTALARFVAADSETPLQKLQWKERVDRLCQAISDLPEREQQVIVMYYYEDLYMAEMAEVLGVSESRVSQLHTRALYNLSRKLEG
jgi:RNA polymerase sigma factor for flagellar operon FliA